MCCWRDVAARFPTGTPSCTLTCSDIITVLISRSLSFINPNELVKRVLLEMNRASAQVQTNTISFSFVLILLDSHASYASMWPPWLWFKQGLVVSICTHLPRVSREVTTKLNTPRSGRCCGQQCVQFSSLVRGAENLAHLLDISQRPPSFSERFGSSFILRVGGKLSFYTDGLVWVSTQAAALWQVRYGWGGFRGHRATLLHKSPEMLRMRDKDATEMHQHHHLQEQQRKLIINVMLVVQGWCGAVLEALSHSNECLDAVYVWNDKLSVNVLEMTL